MPRLALSAVTGLSLLLAAAAVGCATTASSQAPAAQPQPVSAAAIRAVGKHKGDYLPAHNWKIEIDGVLVGGFKDLSLTIDGAEAAGFEKIVEVESDYRNGDDPVTHKRPGKAKYKNITLKRGFIADDSLLAWFELGEKAERKSGSIIYLDREGNEVLRYDFVAAWPSVARGGKVIMDRDSGVTIAEQVEFVTEEMERAVLKTKHDTAKNSVGNIR